VTVAGQSVRIVIAGGHGRPSSETVPAVPRAQAGGSIPISRPGALDVDADADLDLVGLDLLVGGAPTTDPDPPVVGPDDEGGDLLVVGDT